MMREATLGWLTARPIAHRGLHDRSRGIVENTASAFAAAIVGNYAIEFDLQITSDGEAVVFHDDTLNRVTEASGPVKSLTVAELQRITLRHSAARIPTLVDVLKLVDSRVPLVIEIKPQWDGDTSLAARTIDVLRHYKGHHGIMSFDPDVIEAVRRMSPGTIRGMICDDARHPSYDHLPSAIRYEVRTMGFLLRTAPHFMSLDFRVLPWAPVTELRARGVPVITWTIRSLEEARDARRYSDQITFEGFAA